MTSDKPVYRVMVRLGDEGRIPHYLVYAPSTGLCYIDEFDEVNFHNEVCGDVKWLKTVMDGIDGIIALGDMWYIEQHTSYGWIDTDILDGIDMLNHI